MAARARKNGTDTGEKKKSTPPVEYQFKPGNPGRPKGSRNKLGEAFISALHDDFLEHGPDTIARVRAEDPTAYVKVCASLLPKEVKVTSGVEELTDEQLDARIRALASALSLELRDEAGAGHPTGGAQTAH